MQTNKIITLLELSINPQYIDEVIQNAVKTRDNILLEEGCQAFNLTRKKEELSTLVIFAIYTSQQAYDWHLQQEYIKSFFAFLDGKLSATPNGIQLIEL